MNCVPSSSTRIDYERPTGNERRTLERRVESDRTDVNTIWTVGMEEMLIYFIRVNKMLWDPKHPHYTKPMLKRKKVEDITSLLRRESDLSKDLAPEEVWRKFRNLRTFFLREVKKTNEKRMEMNDQHYTSKWIHYNRLQFLLEALRNRENILHRNSSRVGNVKQESVNQSGQTPQHVQESDNEVRVGGEWTSRPENVSVSNRSMGVPVAGAVTEGGSTAAKRKANTSNVNPRKRSRTVNADTLIEKAFDVLQKQDKQTNDVIGAFSNFVSASLRRLPDDQQHVLMSRITQVMSHFHSNRDGS